jgi:hypothetical protein
MTSRLVIPAVRENSVDQAKPIMLVVGELERRHVEAALLALEEGDGDHRRKRHDEEDDKHHRRKEQRSVIAEFLRGFASHLASTTQTSGSNTTPTG